MQPVDDSDSVLLRQFVEDHSEVAFAALVRRHINLVHSVALRCVGAPHQAEEIVQAVFVLLARKAGQLRHDKALSSWLFQTTRLTARNFVRSETRRQRREQQAHMQSVLNESGDDIWRRISPLLDDAVAGLSDKERHAIVLRFYEERNLREIGTALDVSEHAAEKRVNRAVEKLRTFFAKRGVTVGASGLIVALSAHAVQAAPAGLAQAITAGTLATSLVTGVTGASTSTFIVDALKLMTSTKLKITVATSAVLFLAGGLLTFIWHSAHGHHAGGLSGIEGVWEAAAEIPNTPGIEQGQRARMRLQFIFSKTNAAYEVLDTTPERFEAVEFVYEHPVVRFKGQRGEVFEGNVTPNGDEISGTVQAGGRVLHRLRLKRAKAPATGHAPLAESEHQPRSGSDLQGTWRGTLDGGVRVVRVVAKIAEPVAGTYRAELDNETAGWRRQPLLVAYRQPEVSLRVASGAGMFEGVLNGDHTEMVGNWVQNGERTPASFRRAE